MKSTDSRVCVISLSGTAIETPELYVDKFRNNRNKQAVVQLVHDLEAAGYHPIDDGKRSTVKWGFKNVKINYVLDFLEKLEVSPKNEQFNISAITQFLKGYKGRELKNWDIAFATGKSSMPVKFGERIEFNYPVRQYTIENSGKILKMSGSRRRLGTTGDGQFGLGDSQIEEVKSRKKHPSQKDYFIGVDRNPLLTIYLVELGVFIGNETDENLKIKEQCSDEIYYGFGLGIPSLSDHETKYARIVLNKIAIQQMFEGEMDDWDIDEEEYVD